MLDEIERHLDNEGASLRNGRRERTIFLMRLGYPEQGMVFLNGDQVMRPWMELRTAYIHGCFQASLLIGQSFLENLLGEVADFSETGLRLDRVESAAARAGRRLTEQVGSKVFRPFTLGALPDRRFWEPAP